MNYCIVSRSFSRSLSQLYNGIKELSSQLIVKGDVIVCFISNFNPSISEEKHTPNNNSQHRVIGLEKKEINNWKST